MSGTPAGERSSFQALAGGWALVGAAYAVVVCLRLGSADLVGALGGCAGGAAVGAAVPVVRRVLNRGRVQGELPRSGLHALLLGALQAMALSVGLGSLLWMLLRLFGRTIHVVRTPALSIVLVGVAGVAVSIVLARVSRRLVDRLPAGRPARAPAFGGAAVLAIAATVLGARGPSPETRPLDLPLEQRCDGPCPAPRLVVLAIDGLGEDVFEAYAASLPNLLRFAEGASRGTVVTPEPPMSYPIWIAIATGTPVDQNPVSNFEAFREPYPPVSLDRFFQDPLLSVAILPTLVGIQSGFISMVPTTRSGVRGEFFFERPEAGHAAVSCFPATWPARPVRGALVTDRWATHVGEAYFGYPGIVPRSVWPPSLEAELAPLRRDPSEPLEPTLLALAPFAPEDEARFRLEGTLNTYRIAHEKPFLGSRYGFLNGKSCLDAAKRLVEKVRPETLVVYLGGLDMAAHEMLPTDDGAVPWLERSEGERLAPFWGNLAAWFDGEMSWVLGVGSSDTVTVVLGDHGMTRGSADDWLFPNWHYGNGVLLVRGPGYGPETPLGALHPHEVNPILLRAMTR